MSNPLLDSEPASRKARYFNDRQQHLKAGVCLTRTLSLTPNDYYIYYSQGLNLSSQLKHKEAISKYARSVQINPNFSAGYSHWGTSLLMIGKYDEAMLQFQKAIEIKPQVLLCYLDYSLAAFLLGDESKAREILWLGKERSLVSGWTTTFLGIWYGSKIKLLKEEQGTIKDEGQRRGIEKMIFGFEWLLSISPSVYL